jgi:hypothetical protein
MNALASAGAILAATASILGAGMTSATRAASSGLPTLKLALNGRSIAVSGPLQLLRAANDREAPKLGISFPEFAGPLSPGGVQQELIMSDPAYTSSRASCAPRTAGNRPSSAWNVRSRSSGNPSPWCCRGHAHPAADDRQQPQRSSRVPCSHQSRSPPSGGWHPFLAIGRRRTGSDPRDAGK